MDFLGKWHLNSLEKRSMEMPVKYLDVWLKLNTSSNYQMPVCLKEGAVRRTCWTWWLQSLQEIVYPSSNPVSLGIVYSLVSTWACILNGTTNGTNKCFKNILQVYQFYMDCLITAISMTIWSSPLEPLGLIIPVFTNNFASTAFPPNRLRCC